MDLSATIEEYKDAMWSVLHAKQALAHAEAKKQNMCNTLKREIDDSALAEWKGKERLESIEVYRPAGGLVSDSYHFFAHGVMRTSNGQEVQVNWSIGEVVFTKSSGAEPSTALVCENNGPMLPMWRYAYVFDQTKNTYAWQPRQPPADIAELLPEALAVNAPDGYKRIHKKVQERVVKQKI